MTEMLLRVSGTTNPDRMPRAISHGTKTTRVFGLSGDNTDSTAGTFTGTSFDTEQRSAIWFLGFPTAPMTGIGLGGNCTFFPDLDGAWIGGGTFEHLQSTGNFGALGFELLGKGSVGLSSGEDH